MREINDGECMFGKIRDEYEPRSPLRPFPSSVHSNMQNYNETSLDLQNVTMLNRRNPQSQVLPLGWRFLSEDEQCA